MKIAHTPEEFRAACNDLRAHGHSVGLVPTMGALHSGHGSLMRAAFGDGRKPSVTIFVNPTQFGPSEDLARYPRTLESDLKLCQDEGVALVFVPAASDMYAESDATRVCVKGLTEGLCGASRPGHFDGVTTIVTKLFALAGPCHAYFGRKDYQQLQVVKRMAADLMLPVEVIGCPIVRESDGLALSSRNRYLSSTERQQALGIIRGLMQAERAYRDGERRSQALVALVEASLLDSGLRRDYAEVRHATSLTVLERATDTPGDTVLAVAAFCGSTRLIDNFVLGTEPVAASVQVRAAGIGR